MEWFDYLAWAALVAGIIGMVVLIIRRFPKAASIDLDAMPKHAQKTRKHTMIEDRLTRKFGSAKNLAAKGAAPVGTKLRGTLRRWQNKVQALERKYKTPKKGNGKNAEQKEKARQSLDTLMREGEELMKGENWVEAEKKFIEIISLDPQHVPAYKKLGKVYVERKEAEFAIETLEFAKTLAPQDDEVLFILGSAYAAIGNAEEALENLKKATMIVKRNPKYLDALIEAALSKPDKFVAERTWEKLKEANPENKKLAELKKRIDELS